MGVGAALRQRDKAPRQPFGGAPQKHGQHPGDRGTPLPFPGHVAQLQTAREPPSSPPARRSVWPVSQVPMSPSAPGPAPLALTKASLGAFLRGAILLGSIFSTGSSTTEIELQAVSTSTRLHPCGGWKAVLACGSPAWAASQLPAPTCMRLATQGPRRL